MTLKDKKTIQSMVKALERFEDCTVRFSEESWAELNNKIIEDFGDENLPTWNEISVLKEKLKEIK